LSLSICLNISSSHSFDDFLIVFSNDFLTSTLKDVLKLFQNLILRIFDSMKLAFAVFQAKLSIEFDYFNPKIFKIYSFFYYLSVFLLMSINLLFFYKFLRIFS
jgi:hypothetical protein